LALVSELEKFVERNTGRAKFCRIETTDKRDFVRSQGIMSVPSFIFYQNGDRIFTFTEEMVHEKGLAAVQEKLDELSKSA
jgi:thioredoxin-like negative regulator of GroEL